MGDRYREGWAYKSGSHRFRVGDHVRTDYYGKILYGVVTEVQRFDTTFDDVFVYFESCDKVILCSEGALEPITLLDRLAREV